MALFDKPFSYVPHVDPADAVAGADVAVVEPVVSERADQVPPTGQSSPAGATAPSSDVAPADPPVPPAVEVVAATAAAVSPSPLAETTQAPDADPLGAQATLLANPVGAETKASPEPVLEQPAPSAEPTVAVVAPIIQQPTAPVTEPLVTELPPRAAVPASPPGVELVAAEPRSLHPAAGAGGLTVFSRVVPAEHKSMALSDSQRLVNGIDDAEPVLDQLRSLAASLHQARSGREMKVIAVTSSVSGEGKTLLAANLALTLSRSYMRQVLLIDADLRRPNLHRLFGIPSQEGIRTALDCVVEGKPVAVQDVAPRLALLPAGKPVRDPISVLASDAMQRLMSAATNTFDWVIVDTPPVGMLPDVGLLSNLSDAVLLVVEAGRVRYDLVQRTVESIGAERIFGVVLNKVPEHEIVASYGMHYYAPYR